MLNLYKKEAFASLLEVVRGVVEDGAFRNPAHGRHQRAVRVPLEGFVYRDQTRDGGVLFQSRPSGSRGVPVVPHPFVHGRDEIIAAQSGYHLFRFREDFL